jgi:dolichol-phosphate mannosyltransferase
MGDQRVRVIRRVGVRGLASAVVDGMKSARSDTIVVMDADFQHPPEVVPRLYERHREGYDLVVASRYAEGGGVQEWSRLRLLISKLSILASRIAVPSSAKTSDPMSGFFLVDRGKIRLEELRPVGYKILLEILARRPDLRVADVPYVFKRRLYGRSKLGLRTMLDFVIHLVKLSRITRFALVGASGIAVNLSVMYAALKTLGLVDAASVAGIEASILWNFLLHELWTFRYKLSGGLAGVARRLIAYHYSALNGVIIMYGTMRALYTLAGLNPILAQFIGILLGFLANYAMSRGLVWRIAR